MRIMFNVEITATSQDEIDEAYEAMIAAAIDISNSQPTASVVVMAPHEGVYAG